MSLSGGVSFSAPRCRRRHMGSCDRSAQEVPAERGPSCLISPTRFLTSCWLRSSAPPPRSPARIQPLQIRPLPRRPPMGALPGSWSPPPTLSGRSMNTNGSCRGSRSRPRGYGSHRGSRTRRRALPARSSSRPRWTTTAMGGLSRRRRACTSSRGRSPAPRDTRERRRRPPCEAEMSTSGLWRPSRDGPPRSRRTTVRGSSRGPWRPSLTRSGSSTGTRPSTGSSGPPTCRSSPPGRK